MMGLAILGWGWLGRLVGRRLLRVLVGAVVGLDDEGVSLVMGSSWAGIMGECPLGRSSHVRMLVRSVLGVKSGRVR